jgi:hypothetical protein
LNHSRIEFLIDPAFPDFFENTLHLHIGTIAVPSTLESIFPFNKIIKRENEPTKHSYLNDNVQNNEPTQKASTHVPNSHLPRTQ